MRAEHLNLITYRIKTRKLYSWYIFISVVLCGTVVYLLFTLKPQGQSWKDYVAQVFSRQELNADRTVVGVIPSVSPEVSAAKCTRTTPYAMPAEFQRALSLIEQRYSQSLSKHPEWTLPLKSYDNLSEEDHGYINKSPLYYPLSPIYGETSALMSLRNCLDVQYARTNTELDGAEAYFSFSDASNDTDLKITVSQKYAAKNDIITAILLSHEVHHAFQYAYNKLPITKQSCIANEQRAFYNELTFLWSITPDELETVGTQIYLHKTPEMGSLLSLINYAGKSDMGVKFGKMKSYVETNPAYIKECGQYPDE
jgi:hypothetical protein